MFFCRPSGALGVVRTCPRVALRPRGRGLRFTRGHMLRAPPGRGPSGIVIDGRASGRRGPWRRSPGPSIASVRGKNLHQSTACPHRGDRGRAGACGCVGAACARLFVRVQEFEVLVQRFEAHYLAQRRRWSLGNGGHSRTNGFCGHASAVQNDVQRQCVRPL